MKKPSEKIQEKIIWEAGYRLGVRLGVLDAFMFVILIGFLTLLLLNV